MKLPLHMAPSDRSAKALNIRTHLHIVAAQLNPAGYRAISAKPGFRRLIKRRSRRLPPLFRLVRLFCSAAERYAVEDDPSLWENFTSSKRGVEKRKQRALFNDEVRSRKRGLVSTRWGIRHENNQ